MIGGAGHGPFADEARAPVDAEVGFVAEEGNGDVEAARPVGSLAAATRDQGPAGGDVLLPGFGG